MSREPRVRDLLAGVGTAMTLGWLVASGVHDRYPLWWPALGLAFLLAALCGCATHVTQIRTYDREGRVVAQVTNADLRLLSRGSTTLSAGPSATLSAPVLPPLQRPDKTDESVASQFEKLVAQMELEGRLMRALTPYTTATGSIAYHNDDLEMSEDAGKLARTGILAAMTVWLASIGAGL